MLAVSLLTLLILSVLCIIAGIAGVLRNRAKIISGVSHRKKIIGVSVRKFVKQRQWGIVLLAIFGISSIAIAIVSNFNLMPQYNHQIPMQGYNLPLNLQSSGNNPNLTRTGYAVTLSMYGAPRLFDYRYRGLLTNGSAGSVWGLSVNQMRFVYYGLDDQWHETSFQLNEMGWRWIVNGTAYYMSAIVTTNYPTGVRPNTLMEDMIWADNYVPSQFYPDLPNYYYPDAPKGSINATSTNSYGGILPYENNTTMMNNWPEFHQTQAMEGWGGVGWSKPDNNSQVRGAVDHDDQLVFLAQNGQKVLPSQWYRPDLWPRRVEIDIIDPVDNGHSWVYLYFNPSTYATRPTPANQITADYCRTDSYIAPGESASVDWNPTTRMITATNYQMRMNQNNAAQFVNLKITVPGLLQTNVLQEFPKDFVWADGRINFQGSTSFSPVLTGLAVKYGVSGTWFQSCSPGLTPLSGGQPANDAPRTYDDVHEHVGVFYFHGNPDQTDHPTYGEPPYYQDLGWENTNGYKQPRWWNFGTTTNPVHPASTMMGAIAVREAWTKFNGTNDTLSANDGAGYFWNDSAYWVYSSGALATASGTISGTWQQILSPFQNNIALDGGAFNDKMATIDGPVMAYIERFACTRVAIPLQWLSGVDPGLFNLIPLEDPQGNSNTGTNGLVVNFEYYKQQNLIVYPNAFYQVNLTYPAPSLPVYFSEVGSHIDHMWGYFKMFVVAQGIDTNTKLYLGQGVANDTSSAALMQMSAAMNKLSNNAKNRAWTISHGFPYFKNLQQLASDNINTIRVNYSMWDWATSITTAPTGYFPKVLTFNNNSADDSGNGYTATNTMGRLGSPQLTGPYHPWWDTSGASPYEEQWIDNTAWRKTEIWTQNGGNAASSFPATTAGATPYEMIPTCPRDSAGTNVAPDWTILDVPNAGDIWIYMPVRETFEIKSHYDNTWQAPKATADDTGFAFKDNSTNVGNKVGCQEFGLFGQKMALGNSVIPFTIAMVFGNFGITGNTTAANLYGKREWVRNRLQLSLIFDTVFQNAPADTVPNFGPVNHGLFYKPGDTVHLAVLTTYNQSTIPQAKCCPGIISSDLVSSHTGTLVSGNIYRYTINFTWTGVNGGNNVGPTLGTRHDFYYVSFVTPTITNSTCGLFFDSYAPTPAQFSAITPETTTTSTAVTLDWSAKKGLDNSDGTLVKNGLPVSGIASYIVFRNGTAVQEITGPGNGGASYTWVDTNGGAGFTTGTTLQYILETVDMAGNKANATARLTKISLAVTDPGAWDSTIKWTSNSPFQLTWNAHPGSSITSYILWRSKQNESGGYADVGGVLFTSSHSWTQGFGTGNSSVIGTDAMYWYILTSTNGALMTNSSPISVILDKKSPSNASIAMLTSPYAPVSMQIPIDITGSKKAIDPGFFGPGDPRNTGSGVVNYTIWRSMNFGTGWSTPASRGTVSPDMIENNVWYDVDSTLASSNGYMFRYWVIARDNAGNWANSTPIQFTFSIQNLSKYVLSIPQVVSNVTTCQQNHWIGYMVKVQNIGTESTTINSLTVNMMWSGINETSLYTIVAPVNYM